MEHLVTFKAAEGRDGQHVAASLDDALRFIERLHNAEEASDIRLHRMQEVPIEFRTYVKVEVRGADAGTPDGGTPEEADDHERALVGSAVGVADGESGGEQPSRRLFNRS